jgi:ribosome-associated toxin RatA of RatAB toxin-antitoxin module
MTHIHTSARMAYTPKQMYDLVNDTAAYPGYLPLCSHVRVHAKTAERQTATITLAKGKLKFDFTIAHVLEDAKRIEVVLVDGPFKRLRGAWTFAAAGHGGCEVSLELDFEFSNPLLGMAFGGLFKSITESMVGAFSEQAALRYGKPHGAG